MVAGIIIRDVSHVKSLDRQESFERIRHTQQYKDRQEKRRLKRLKKIYDLKTPCKCGEVDPRCIDFHHIDPSNKEFTIGSSGVSWQRILDEVKKCICICSNCHRKLHAPKELGLE